MAAEFQEGRYLDRGDPGDDAALDRIAGATGPATDAPTDSVDHFPLDSIGGFHDSDFGIAFIDEPPPHASAFNIESQASVVEGSPWAVDAIHPDIPDFDKSVQEKVIGRDTRGFVSAADVRRFPYAAVCLIRAHFHDGTFTGTGVLASRHMVVTAAHNLVRSQRATRVEVFFGAFHGSSVAARVANRIETHPRYRSTVDPPEVDYGAIFFSQALTEIDYIRFVRVQDSQTYLKIRDKVEIPGFPRVNRSAGVMYTSRDRIHDVLVSGRIEHQVDTSEGQSGAPIIGWFPQPSGPPVPGVIGIHNQNDTSPRPLNYGAFVNQNMITRLRSWNHAS